ncbi:MAG TPA: hypothetical protein VIY52_28185 [Streptosporangiaceae bacterium]
MKSSHLGHLEVAAVCLALAGEQLAQRTRAAQPRQISGAQPRPERDRQGNQGQVGGGRDDLGGPGIPPHVEIHLQAPRGQAAALLRAIIGTTRTAAEPSALTEIAARCAGLPLALRIAAERAVARPHQTLAALAAQLAAHDRLDVLATADDPATSVRNVLSWSCQSLPAAAAQMFCLLGLHPGPEISVPAAAALTASDEGRARQLIEELADANLIEEVAADRYRFHDLLRAFAAERARAETDAAARTAALRRVLTWYLRTADAVDRDISRWIEISAGGSRFSRA